MVGNSPASKPDAAWVTKCPKLVAEAPDTFGDTVELLSFTLDKYFQCANKHNAWVEYEQKRNK